MGASSSTVNPDPAILPDEPLGVSALIDGARAIAIHVILRWMAIET